VPISFATGTPIGGNGRGKQASHPVDQKPPDGPRLCTALKSHGVERADSCLIRHADRDKPGKQASHPVDRKAVDGP